MQIVKCLQYLVAGAVFFFCTLPVFAAKASNAVFVFPGYAPRDFCPDGFSQKETVDGLVNFFTGVGYEEGKDLHVFYYQAYESMDDLETGIYQEILPALDTAVAKLNPDQKIDVIGHSLGHFVGLYSAVTHPKLKDRIGTLVGLGGSGLGVKKPWTPHLPGKLPAGRCVNAVLDQYDQEMNPVLRWLDQDSFFMSSFQQNYSSEIKKLRKCSIWSPDDPSKEEYGNFRDGNSWNIKLKSLPKPGRCHPIETRPHCVVKCGCIREKMKSHMALAWHEDAHAAIGRGCLRW